MVEHKELLKPSYARTSIRKNEGQSSEADNFGQTNHRLSNGNLELPELNQIQRRQPVNGQKTPSKIWGPQSCEMYR